MTEIDRKFRQAVKEGTKRNYKRAISLLLEVLTAGDTYIDAYLYLGRAYHAVGDTKRSILYLSFFTERCPEEPAGWFFLGRSYLAEGLTQRAIEVLDKAIALRPEESSNYGYMGLAYIKRKEFEQAIHYFEKALQYDPENSKLYDGYLNALFLHAIRLFFQEEYELVVQMLEFLKEKGKNDFLIPLYLGKAYKEIGDIEQSFVYYDEAYHRNPEDESIRIQRAYILYLLGEHAESKAEFDTLSQSHPELTEIQYNDGYIHRFLGIKHFQNSEFRKAAFHGVQALKHGRSYELHILVGESYRNLGDREKARNHYTRASEFKRDALEPYYGITMAYWEEEKYKEAYDVLAKILRLSPEDEIGMYYLTLVKCKLQYPTNETIPLVQEQLRVSGPDPFLLTELGNQYIREDFFRLAPKWFEKALSLSSTYEPALYGRILAYKGIGAEEELIESYKDYLDKAGYSLSVHLHYINDLFVQSRYKEAAEEVETILPKSKIDENLQRLLAICYRNTGKFKEAAIIYRQLLKADHENETYLRSLLFCLEKAGRRPQAIKLLQSALGYFPNSATLHLIAGVLYEKELDHEKALESFRRAAELDPRDWKPPYNMGLIYKKKGMEAFGNKYVQKAEKIRAEIGKK